MGRPLDPKHNHKIDLKDAAIEARRYRKGGPSKLGDSGAFNKDPVLEMLHQHGCVGMRYYCAKNAKGEDTVVLVGVDKEGNDMTAGIMLNQAFPCPPWCPDEDPLNE